MFTLPRWNFLCWFSTNMPANSCEQYSHLYNCLRFVWPAWALKCSRKLSFRVKTRMQTCNTYSWVRRVYKWLRSGTKAQLTWQGKVGRSEPSHPVCILWRTKWYLRLNSLWQTGHETGLKSAKQNIQRKILENEKYVKYRAVSHLDCEFVGDTWAFSCQHISRHIYCSNTCHLHHVRLFGVDWRRLPW